MNAPRLPALRQGLVIGAVAVTTLLTPAVARPAFAHHGSGGPVRLYLGSLRLEPQGDGWAVRTDLNDTSSGAPAPGYLVEVTGTGPQGASFGPISLDDDKADGHYGGALGRLAPGNWSLTVDVGDVPGGDGYVVPINRTWPLRLQAGQAVDLIGRSSPAGRSTSSGSGTDVTPILLGAGLAALLGGSALWLTRRRRTMVPAR